MLRYEFGTVREEEKRGGGCGYLVHVKDLYLISLYPWNGSLFKNLFENLVEAGRRYYLL